VPTARPFACVWGSPIGHSLSPVLHSAAYEVLGLSWDYLAQEVDEQSLAEHWLARSLDLVGLSLTMPLKEAIVPLIEQRTPVVELLGVANTVTFREGQPALANTDPWGVHGALADHTVEAKHAWILGAGATARAVGYGLHLGGTTSITLVARSLERATPTLGVLEQMGLRVHLVDALDEASLEQPELVVSTLPGGAEAPWEISPAVVDSAALLDVAYHPWPSQLALRWGGSPKPVISGVWMLVHQALMQIRLFHSGEMTSPVPHEEKVLRAMKRAVNLPAA
jgi:shikimate dehydrogenase